jgi:hypothetical protein
VSLLQTEISDNKLLAMKEKKQAIEEAVENQVKECDEQRKKDKKTCDIIVEGHIKDLENCQMTCDLNDVN